MSTVISPTIVRQIEVVSSWCGLGNPGYKTEKLTIHKKADRYSRKQEGQSVLDDVPDLAITKLLIALGQPPVPQLIPSRFALPSGFIKSHYSMRWTDDHPSLTVHIHCAKGRIIEIRSNSQHKFMLPFNITDSQVKLSYKTYDPDLSVALASLMPEKFLGRARVLPRDWRFELSRWGDHKKASLPEDSHQLTESSIIPTDPEKIIILAEEHCDPNTELHSAVFEKLEPPVRRRQSDFFDEYAERRGEISSRLLMQNSLETVKSLLARGADPDFADSTGFTALMYAAKPPLDRDRFRLLLEAGADIEARRRIDLKSGLHLACTSGEAETAIEWIRAGADLESQTLTGATPLMCAVSWSQIVRELLNHGASVHSVDHDGHNPLVYAIYFQTYLGAEDQIEAIQMMISAGIDVNGLDRVGLTPLSHARTVLHDTLLAEKVHQSFHPKYTPLSYLGWTPRSLAEAIVKILTDAGAHE